MINVLKHFLAARWRWRILNNQPRLEKYQHKKRTEIVNFALENSSFYRQHWDHADLNDWEHLPLLNKTLMRNNFDAFNTAGIKKEEALSVALQAEQDRNFIPKLKGCTVGLSSGTTSERGLFLVSQAEQDMWTGVILARALHSLNRQRVALFLRSNSNLYEQVRQGGWIQFCYFNLMLDIEYTVRELNAYQPTLIVSPPSTLATLAEQVEKGKLKINPRRLVSVAEVLEPQDKVRLEQVFGVTVHQIYQATEGLLAISCKHGSLHIQEDLIKMEFETLADDLVTPILTDLHRKTQPMIRYHLGDILRLDSQGCPCGQLWPVIKQIEGREGDVLRFGAKKIFPHLLRDVILSVSGVKDYLVSQESENKVNVYLVVFDDAGDILLSRGFVEVSALHPTQVTKGLDALRFDHIANEVNAKLMTLFKMQGIDSKLELVQGLPARAANIKRRRVTSTQAKMIE